ncbi:DUF4870 domain-containing protein [Flavobacterium sp. AG291]|uniref:DUF4870 domain-containing protein n=1 Tax=Flavobacterium sp. AG291 TaxID=2184000 RepID=UPI000E0A04AD|nr:DUF4870 domain-containing protein [Flavobacterium sp. AG291]RDI11196.1 hypothetical protein DEU42_106130 [Flavobacterium sp. AG291]
METIANKNTSTILQLSALTQYFIPLGNFIFPALIWSLKKNDSEFVDYNGKQAINFQLSLFLYSFLLAVIAIPIFLCTFFSNMDLIINSDGEWIIEQFSLGNITWLVLIAVIAVCIVILLKTAELFLILYAAVKNNNGQRYDFPLTIKFIK